MNAMFMGQCGSILAFLPVTSLNESIEDHAREEQVEVVELVLDPRSEGESGDVPDNNVIDVRAFVASLPERLRDIAHRAYWHDQSPTEIASDLGLTRSAVSHAIARIKILGRAYFGLPAE